MNLGKKVKILCSACGTLTNSEQVLILCELMNSISNILQQREWFLSRNLLGNRGHIITCMDAAVAKALKILCEANFQPNLTRVMQRFSRREDVDIYFQALVKKISKLGPAEALSRYELNTLLGYYYQMIAIIDIMVHLWPTDLVVMQSHRLVVETLDLSLLQQSQVHLKEVAKILEEFKCMLEMECYEPALKELSDMISTYEAIIIQRNVHRHKSILKPADPKCTEESKLFADMDEFDPKTFRKLVCFLEVAFVLRFLLEHKIIFPVEKFLGDTIRVMGKLSENICCLSLTAVPIYPNGQTATCLPKLLKFIDKMQGSLENLNTYLKNGTVVKNSETIRTIQELWGAYSTLLDRYAAKSRDEDQCQEKMNIFPISTYTLKSYKLKRLARIYRYLNFLKEFYTALSVNFDCNNNNQNQDAIIFIQSKMTTISDSIVCEDKDRFNCYILEHKKPQKIGCKLGLPRSNSCKTNFSLPSILTIPQPEKRKPRPSIYTYGDSGNDIYL